MQHYRSNQAALEAASGSAAVKAALASGSTVADLIREDQERAAELYRKCFRPVLRKRRRRHHHSRR